MEETIIMKREQQKLPSKHEFLEAVIGFGVLAFCFGIGELLAVEAIHSLKEFISKN